MGNNQDINQEHIEETIISLLSVVGLEFRDQVGILESVKQQLFENRHLENEAHV